MSESEQSSNGANGNTDNVGNKTIARILSTKVNIRLFEGNTPDSTTIDEFLNSLEAFYLTEGIHDDRIRIAEVSRYLNNKVGDAYMIVNSKLFKNITSWAAYKKKLLDLFQLESHYDTICAIRELNDIKLGKDTYQMFIAKISNQIDTIKESAKANYQLDIDDKTLKLLALANIEKEIPNAHKHKYRENVDLSKDLWDQTQKVIKIIQKDQTKTKIVNIVESDEEDVNWVKHNEARQHNKPQNVSQNVSHNNHENQKSVNARNFAEMLCYNCGYGGHAIKNCRNQAYCTYCDKVGHNVLKCWFKNESAKNSNFRSRNFPNKIT
jgi:hypothetical protein